MGRKVGVELGTGGFQLRAVVEHGAGLAALHVSVQLLCVVGGGGRLHGDKELRVHGVHLVFLFSVRQRDGEGLRMDGGCGCPILRETPSQLQLQF